MLRLSLWVCRRGRLSCSATSIGTRDTARQVLSLVEHLNPLSPGQSQYSLCSCCWYCCGGFTSSPDPKLYHPSFMALPSLCYMCRCLSMTPCFAVLSILFPSCVFPSGRWSVRMSSTMPSPTPGRITPSTMLCATSFWTAIWMKKQVQRQKMTQRS